MVRRPRRPTHEDEPIEEPVEAEATYDPEPVEPVPEPVPEPQEVPMPPPSVAPLAASGNGSHPAPNIGGVAITPATTTTDEQAIIAQQQILIATTAQMVRDLETALNLAPPPPTTPPAPPATNVNLATVITTQTAAIRTQAAYVQHLLDLQVALNPGP